VNKTDMDRATVYAHALGFKVTGFEFSSGRIAITVEDATGVVRVIGLSCGDDETEVLKRAIENDNGDD